VNVDDELSSLARETLELSAQPCLPAGTSAVDDAMVFGDWLQRYVGGEVSPLVRVSNTTRSVVVRLEDLKSWLGAHERPNTGLSLHGPSSGDTAVVAELRLVPITGGGRIDIWDK
jgi:hypothetical protein